MTPKEILDIIILDVDDYLHCNCESRCGDNEIVVYFTIEDEISSHSMCNNYTSLGNQFYMSINRIYKNRSILSELTEDKISVMMVHDS